MSKTLRQAIFWSILGASAAALIYGFIIGDAQFTRMEASTL